MLSALVRENTAAYNPRPRLEKEDRIPSAIQLAMDPKDLRIRELLDWCLRTNDGPAWDELEVRIRPATQRTVYKALCPSHRHDRALIQDLIQDSYVKILKALRGFQYRSDGEFFGWVQRIARSAVADWYRRLKPEEFDETALQTAEDPTSSEERRMHKLRCDEVEQRLRETDATEKEQDMFRLYFRRGLTAKEIGNLPEVNLTEKSVETVIARIVRQLRRSVGGAAAAGAGA